MHINEMKVGLERITKHIFDRETTIKYSDLITDKTALIVIDMVNGFTSEGLLQSLRVKVLTPEVMNIVNNCKEKGIPIIAFADSHSPNSPEFASYGAHCQTGTRESELIDELKDVGGYLINKNSSNGFLEPEFQDWLKAHSSIRDFVVIGDCTDICIIQFCLTLKAHFNRLDRVSRMIVPLNAVDTYDYDLHHGDLTHTMALYFMAMNGIDIVKSFV